MPAAARRQRKLFKELLMEAQGSQVLMRKAWDAVVARAVSEHRTFKKQEVIEEIRKARKQQPEKIPA